MTNKQDPIRAAVPNDFKQYLCITRYETLKYLRSKRLLAIMIILVLIVGLILILPPALGHDYPSDALDFAQMFIGFATILVILCVTFFGADAIVSEFQHRTGYLLFPNPVERFVILFGKYTASFLSSLFVISIFYGVVMISVSAVNRSLPGEIGLSFLFCIVYLAAGLSIAFLISTLMKGTTSASVLTFFLFFLIIPLIDTVFTFSQVKPWLSITFASNIVVYILFVPYPSDQVEKIPYQGGTMEITNYFPDPAISVGVMMVYFILAFALTFYLFDRKELKG